jgi:hypothetical protein
MAKGYAEGPAAEASLAMPTSGRADSVRASVGNDRSTRMQSARGDR